MPYLHDVLQGCGQDQDHTRSGRTCWRRQATTARWTRDNGPRFDEPQPLGRGQDDSGTRVCRLRIGCTLQLRAVVLDGKVLVS